MEKAIKKVDSEAAKEEAEGAAGGQKPIDRTMLATNSIDNKETAKLYRTYLTPKEIPGIIPIPNVFCNS